MYLRTEWSNPSPACRLRSKKTSDAFSRGDSGGGVRRARKSNHLTAMNTLLYMELYMGKTANGISGQRTRCVIALRMVRQRGQR